jgi:hypothetical protein
MQIWAKNILFGTFGSHKNEKNPKITKVPPYFFFNYPKEHIHQFLDQSVHFPGSRDFSAKSGGHVRIEKLAKNVVFQPKIGDFANIFKITKTHLITSFRQILGHFEHFLVKIVIFRAFLAHLC